jgi:hypothetical protein
MPQCCEANNDVRGMCFATIGDLHNMALWQVLEMRKCPNLEYAVAWWIDNKFHNDIVLPGNNSVISCQLVKKLPVWKYIDVINPDFMFMMGVCATIHRFNRDSDTESDSESESESESDPKILSE